MVTFDGPAVTFDGSVVTFNGSVVTFDDDSWQKELGDGGAAKHKTREPSCRDPQKAPPQTKLSSRHFTVD
jgi:hypothetical protein